MSGVKAAAVPEQLFIAGVVVFLMVVVLDLIGYLAFWPWAYVLGLRTFFETRPGLAPPSFMVGSTIATNHGKFKRVSADRVLVRERQDLVFIHLGLRGSIMWESNRAMIEVRVPLSLLAAIPIATGDLVAKVESGGPEALIILMPFLGIVAGVTVWWERRRMRLLVDEYERSAKEMRPHA